MKKDSLLKKNRNSYLKEYQKSMKDILTKQYIIEENTKVNSKLLNKYFLKIINDTPFLIKRYLNNNIFGK